MHEAEPPLAVIDYICQHPQANKASRDPLVLLLLHDRNLSQTLDWLAKHVK